jgi:hypothetical protein
MGRSCGDAINGKKRGKGRTVAYTFAHVRIEEEVSKKNRRERREVVELEMLLSDAYMTKGERLAFNARERLVMKAE